MKYNWDWTVILCTSDDEAEQASWLWFLARDEVCQNPYLEWILIGFGWTIAVALCAWVITFILGSIIGIARTMEGHKLVYTLATVYVEIFRNIPLLVQMFLWFFVFPEMLPESAGHWLKRELPLPEFWTAVVCLGMYQASRTAEQVRAGIQSIPPGQTAAGLALGLTMFQVYRGILLPMSYRIIIPPLTSDFMGIFKNSSVALVIGVVELTAQARQVSEYSYAVFEAFTAATFLYILVTFIVVTTMTYVEKKIHIPGSISLEEK
jgi:glutamate/aspartate transport system permease protein